MICSYLILPTIYEVTYCWLILTFGLSYLGGAVGSLILMA